MTVDAVWEPLNPFDLPRLVARLNAPWWLAGGWALELFAGQPIREHGDLDIEMPRHAAPQLGRALAGWDLQLAHAGRLQSWDGERPVRPPVNSLWCRPTVDGPWRLQVMLATVEDGRWRYRRDERVSRPLDEVCFAGPAGLLVIAPEVQLLYKSHEPRAKDEQDFDAVLTLLSPAQREWLADALALVAPGHPWTARLEAR